MTRSGDSNLYAYVGGDPVNYIDPKGLWLLPVAGVLIGGAAQAWTNYEAYSCGRISGSQFAASIAIGGAVGGLATIPTGIIGGAVAGGLGSALNEMVNADIGAKKQDLGELVKAIGVGALAGGFANYLGIAGSKFLVTEKVIGKTIPLAPVKTQAELGGAIGTALGTAWATF